MTRALLLVTLIASVASAEEKLPGMDAYEQGDFKRATKEMEPAALNPRLTAEARAKARMYLAAAFFALGDKESVKQNLTALAREYPEVRMDPGLFDPELVSQAEKIRAQVQDQAAREQALALQSRLDQKEEKKQDSQQIEKPVEPPQTAEKNVRLRAGAAWMSFLGPGESDWSIAPNLSVVFGNIEAGVKVIPGRLQVDENHTKPQMGYGAEAAYLFLDGMVQPRLGAHAIGYSGTDNFLAYAGAVGGVRVQVAKPVILTADLSGDYKLFRSGSDVLVVPGVDYRAFDVTLSAGVQLQLGLF